MKNVLTIFKNNWASCLIDHGSCWPWNASSGTSCCPSSSGNRNLFNFGSCHRAGCSSSMDAGSGRSRFLSRGDSDLQSQLTGWGHLTPSFFASAISNPTASARFHLWSHRCFRRASSYFDFWKFSVSDSPSAAGCSNSGPRNSFRETGSRCCCFSAYSDSINSSNSDLAGRCRWTLELLAFARSLLSAATCCHSWSRSDLFGSPLTSAIVLAQADCPAMVLTLRSSNHSWRLGWGSAAHLANIY